MQSPTQDPSFKALLERLQEQNNQAFATQLDQLKAEREIADEDNNKSEIQLDESNENLKRIEATTSSLGSSLSEGLSNVSDDVIEAQDLLDNVNASLTEIDGTLKEIKKLFEAEMLTSLSNIREAITGIKLDIDLKDLQTAIEKVGYDVGTDIDKGHLSGLIGALNVNLSLTQNEQIKELSLIRKLAEGSVEYDKEAAQYRNTSGRDVEGKVSGKTSKSGGFIDFETARDTLSGQGDRAKKENRLNLITDVTTKRSRSTSNYNSPGKLTAKSLGADSDSSVPEITSKGPKVFSEDLKEKESEVIPGISPVKRARRERGGAPEVTRAPKITPKNKKEEEPLRFGSPSDFLEGAKERIGSIKSFFSGPVKAKKDEDVEDVTPSLEVETRKKVVKEAAITGIEPSKDKIKTETEGIAKESKTDVELSKQQLQITKDSLNELKAIRVALSPKKEKKDKASPGSKEASVGKAASKGSVTTTAASPAVGGALVTPAAATSAPSTNPLAAAAPAVAAAEAPEAGKGILDVASQALDLIPEGGKNPPGKPAGKAAKGIGGRILGGLGKAARFLGPVGAIAGAAYSGFEGYKNTGENFDLKEGQEATVGQKASSTLGGIASGATFGLLDEKTASQGIHKAGTAIGNFFGMGDKSAAVTPAGAAPSTGQAMAKASTENADMSRDVANQAPSSTSVVSTNVSNNNTTSYVPMKSVPRSEQGSSLNRYMDRTAVY